MFPLSEGSLGSQSNAATATWAVKQQKVQSSKQSHPCGNDKTAQKGERQKKCAEAYLGMTWELPREADPEGPCRHLHRCLNIPPITKPSTAREGICFHKFQQFPAGLQK